MGESRKKTKKYEGMSGRKGGEVVVEEEEERIFFVRNSWTLEHLGRGLTYLGLFHLYESFS